MRKASFCISSTLILLFAASFSAGQVSSSGAGFPGGSTSIFASDENPNLRSPFGASTVGSSSTAPEAFNAYPSAGSSAGQGTFPGTFGTGNQGPGIGYSGAVDGTGTIQGSAAGGTRGSIFHGTGPTSPRERSTSQNAGEGYGASPFRGNNSTIAQENSSG